MRVSWEWLNTLVDLNGITPEGLAAALTNAGLEVEDIETVGPPFSGVVVGFVKQVEPHPNADRLRLVTVSLGPLGENRVVCGAPNVAEGMRIAYAQIGAKVINRKEGTLFELKPVKIRDVESTGMICSLEELGLENDYPKGEDGIWPITDLVGDPQLGQDLKQALGLATDTVLVVTPNANRGDLMSMLGIAREVSALYERPLKRPDVPAYDTVPTGPYQIQLNDPSVCAYYAGAVLTGVTLGESPDWLKRRLTSAGIRTISNVVDITNYVMLEYGQPLHAFDLEKLGTSGTIGVRHAKPGETLQSLDGVERPLTAQSVVVTFNDAPVALAGVMGGESTEIGDTTGQVFLEAAYFPPASNRRSARSVGLRTESSARFERGVDPASTRLAFNRAIALMQELCGAQPVSVAQDDHRQLDTPAVTLSLKRIDKILGMPIPLENTRSILTNLGFTLGPGKGDGDSLSVQIPSFRASDVTREIDVIEEVIRIYGYDKVPYTLPQGTAAPVVTLRARFLQQVRRAMTACGLCEAQTLSLIGDKLLAETGFTQAPETTVRVTNSHSQDHTFLRQCLAPTLVASAKHNQDQGNDAVWLFELGRTYFKTRPAAEKDSGVTETLNLGVVLTGHPAQGQWHQTLNTDFYTLKGIAENLFSQLGVAGQVRWSGQTDVSALHPGQTATLKLGKTPLGFVGRLHPVLEGKLKFKAPVYLMELDLDVLFAAVAKKQATGDTFAPLSPYPAVDRDIAFTVPDTVTHQQIVSALNQAQEPLLQTVTLFDEYRGPQVGEGNRSLAYRLTLQSAEATLTEAAIEAAMDKLKRQLTDQLPVRFR